jgi:hypothetical protein
LTDDEPWFLSVSNGSFVRRSGDFSFYYSVPEFENQSFSPMQPYKIVVEEKALRIRGDVYALSSSGLNVDSALFSMEVLVRDNYGQVLYAFTTDTTVVGDPYLENGQRVVRTIEDENAFVVWEEGIAGYDQLSGFIQLKKDFPDKYAVYVTYYFEETSYQITSVNFNPVFDEVYDGQSYAVYCVPKGGTNANAEQTSAVHYVKIDRSGRLIETSQNGSTGNFNFAKYTSTFDQKPFWTKEAESTTAAVVSAGDGTITLSDASGFPDNGILLLGENINQIVTGTSNVSELLPYSAITGNTLTLVETVTGDSFPAGTAVKLFSFSALCSAMGDNTLQWLVLSEVNVKKTSSIEDLSILDVRNPGGTIKKKHFRSAMIKDPRSIWAKSGSFQARGQPIPGETAAIVKVPYTVLEDYGGQFTKQEVERIILTRHLAAGVVPVVIYHGAIPEISSITSTSDSITISWPSEGINYAYNVYISSLKDGPWEKLNYDPVGGGIYGYGSYDSTSYGFSMYGMTDYEYGLYGTTGIYGGYDYSHEWAGSFTIFPLHQNRIYYLTVSAVEVYTEIEGPKSIPMGIRTKGV